MKQQYVNKILDLAKGVTPEIREEALKTLDISNQTLGRYLSGDIVKFDLADRLIEFLESKVTAAANG